MAQDNEIFKCRCCGEKYEHIMSSDDDISICRGCASDEIRLWLYNKSIKDKGGK
tara:strand:- start:35 stop:196 length:162 start_codon:yes stop_codon:yes gene_type:complete